MISALSRRMQVIKPLRTVRWLATFEEDDAAMEQTARHAFAQSCYLKINWKISEQAMVEEALHRMVVNKIGCLAVTEGAGDSGTVVGIISERDYVGKVALLNKNPKTTPVSEVCTHGKANLISVTLDNPVDACMRKVLARDIRHLLIREKDTGNMVGLISIKDLVKCVVAKHDAVVHRLESVVLTSEFFKQI
jgi:CBS domain-containing protein